MQKRRKPDARHQEMIDFAINEAKKSILNEYIKHAFLYGSVARGNWRFGSDVDILFVIDSETPDDEEMHEAKRQLLGMNPNGPEYITTPDLDIRIMFERNWEKRDDIYVKEIKRDGIDLWKSNYTN